MKGGEKRLTTVASGGPTENVILHSPQSKVFFIHPTASWRLGTVVSANPKHVIVLDPASNSEFTVKHSEIHPVIDNYEQQETDDLLHLSELHEATLLHNIQSRFSKDKIYTYTGPIVIAMNPFHKMSSLYDEDTIKQYRGQKYSELPPHIFSVADHAYQSMLSNQQNQSILISGESGAGKTETTKLLMKYLAAVSGRNLNTGNIQQQIMEANPILEAFGNAKTLRNNNSSRFGRWISIQFDGKGCLSGAVILNYLLEKSRIVYQAKGERNYHIFYQLLAGAKSSGLSEKFRLKDVNSFNYLNQSGCTSIDGVDDAADFDSLKNAMSILGILEEDQTSLFKALAAILHLGNISFVLNEKNENWSAAVIENKEVLKFVASLLGVDARALEHSLVTRMNLIRGEYFEVPLDLEKARDARDSLAKAIYNEIFGWLVHRINEKIADYSSERFIGLLDIFGFESFAVNSFEQFCINLANEKLQQHYNRHTFKWEQDACYKEEIDYTKIDFVDNQLCLDLIEKKLGILALLDEESNFPKATDESFLAKLLQHHADHSYFSKTPKSTSAFSIKHYAAEVSYESANFLEKNKDTLKDDVIKLLRGSTDPFLRSLMSDKNKDKQTKSKKLTVSGAFKLQLDQLMEEIEKTSPHWIRCIKPNQEKQAQFFDGPAVLHQLRCAGVLETVRIRKSGYPIRIPVDDFAKRYKMLHTGKIAAKTARAMCDSIINHLKFSKADCQIGLTRVFLRQEQFDKLDKLRADKLHQPVIIIQRVVRGFLSRLKFKRGKAARKVQRAWRGYYYKTKYEKIRAATLLLQTRLRQIICAKQFKSMRIQNKPANGIASPEAKRPIAPVTKTPRNDAIAGLELGDDVILRALASAYGLDSGVTLSKLEDLEQGLLQALERVRGLKEKAVKKPVAKPPPKMPSSQFKLQSKPAPSQMKPTPSQVKPAPSLSPSSAPSPLSPSLQRKPTPLNTTSPSPSPQLKSSSSPSVVANAKLASPSPLSPLASPPPQRKPPTAPAPAPAPVAANGIKRTASNPPKPTSPTASFTPSSPFASSAPTTPSSSAPPPTPPPPPPVSPRKTPAKPFAQPAKPSASPSSSSSSSSFFSKFKKSGTSKPAASTPVEPAPAPTPAPSPLSSLPTSSPSLPPGGFATRSRPAPARRNKNNKQIKPYQPPPGSVWNDDEDATSPSPSSPSPATATAPSPSPSTSAPSVPKSGFFKKPPTPNK